MSTATKMSGMIKGSCPTVFVSDLDRAVNFYSQTLGLATQVHVPGQFAMIDAGGSTIGLHPAGPHSPKPGTRGAIHVGFNVTAPIEDVVRELQAAGVKFRGPIIDDAPVKLAYFDDPDGNDLYLCQYASQPGKPAHP